VTPPPARAGAPGAGGPDALRWPAAPAQAASFSFSARTAQTLTVADIVVRVRERWTLALVPVVLGLAGAAAYTLTAPPVYVSMASVVVQPVLAEQFGNVNLSSVINMSTEAQLARSSAVSVSAGQKLGLSGEAVRAAFSVDTPQDTQVLNIHFRSGTADGAAAGAQTVAEAYLAYREGSAQADADRRLASIAEQIDTVNARLAEGGGQTGAYQEALRALLADQRELTSIKATSGGRVITKAVAPGRRSSPRPVVDLAIGLAVGAIGGLVLSVTWPRRRRGSAAVAVAPRSSEVVGAAGWIPTGSTGPTEDEATDVFDVFDVCHVEDADAAGDTVDGGGQREDLEASDEADRTGEGDLHEDRADENRADEDRADENRADENRADAPDRHPAAPPPHSPQPPPIPWPGRPGIRPGTPSGATGTRSTSPAIGGAPRPGSARTGPGSLPLPTRRSVQPPRSGGSQINRSMPWFNR